MHGRAGQYHAAPEDRTYLINFWIGAFPPSWRDPAALAGWFVRAHTGPLFAYPHGANRLPWLTIFIFGSFIWGIALHIRRNLKIVILLVLPFLLVLTAAALRRYPYGISAQACGPVSRSLDCAFGGRWAWLDLRSMSAITAWTLGYSSSYARFGGNGVLAARA